MFTALEKSQDAIEITSEDNYVQVGGSGGPVLLGLWFCLFSFSELKSSSKFFLFLFNVQETSFSIEDDQSAIYAM